jgi:hypothetical protein
MGSALSGLLHCTRNPRAGLLRRCALGYLVAPRWGLNPPLPNLQPCGGIATRARKALLPKPGIPPFFGGGLEGLRFATLRRLGAAATWKAMMNRSLVSVALMFLLTIAARAGDVVVYKGAGPYFASLSATPAPAAFRFFLVVDFQTGDSGSVLYYIKDGKKGVAGTSDLHVTRATSQNIKPITLLASGAATETDLNSFSFSTLMIRGFDSSLKIATSPVERVIARPRILKGTSLNPASNDTTGRFSEVRFNLTFNSALTIAANNEAQTVAQVIQTLKDGLTAQGYSFE